MSVTSLSPADYIIFATKAYRNSDRDVQSSSQTHEERNNALDLPSGWKMMRKEAYNVQNAGSSEELVGTKAEGYSSGFGARVFEKEGDQDDFRLTGSEFVIAFRGTDQPEYFADLQEWIDFFLGGGTSQQLQDAIQFTEMVLDDIATEKGITKQAALQLVTFTGHSLGGFLSTLMGAIYQRPAMSFDAPPTALEGFDYAANPGQYGATTAPALTGVNPFERNVELSNNADQYVRNVILEGDIATWAPGTNLGQPHEAINLGEVLDLEHRVSLHSTDLLALSLLRSTDNGETKDFAALARQNPYLSKHIANPDLAGLPDHRSESLDDSENLDVGVVLNEITKNDILYGNFHEAFSKLNVANAAFELDEGDDKSTLTEVAVQFTRELVRRDNNAFYTDKILGDDAGTISLTFDHTKNATNLDADSSDAHHQLAVDTGAETNSDLRVFVWLKENAVSSDSGIGNVDYHYALESGANLTASDRNDLIFGFTEKKGTVYILELKPFVSINNYMLP
ncbi:MAG: hypothetical protein AAGJ09_10335 [Pseudomonadota bacterium]